MTETYGYSPVVRIPRGATHVRLTDNSTNYLGNGDIKRWTNNQLLLYIMKKNIVWLLALMDESERYFLNGNWMVDWPGRYETSGVAFHYERIKDSEIVRSRGPLQQDLIVMVYTHSSHSSSIFSVPYQLSERCLFKKKRNKDKDQVVFCR